jgi:hypothetical protein
MIFLLFSRAVDWVDYPPATIQLNESYILPFDQLRKAGPRESAKLVIIHTEHELQSTELLCAIRWLCAVVVLIPFGVATDGTHDELTHQANQLCFVQLAVARVFNKVALSEHA